jgi:hypothetical protein
MVAAQTAYSVSSLLALVYQVLSHYYKVTSSLVDIGRKTRDNSGRKQVNLDTGSDNVSTDLLKNINN